MEAVLVEFQQIPEVERATARVASHGFPTTSYRLESPRVMGF